MKLKYIFIIILVIVTAYFAVNITSMNWEKTEEEVGFHSDITKDPFTMAQRLLDANGIEWQKDKQFTKDIDLGYKTIPDDSLLILDEGVLVNSTAVDYKLLDWVRNGGRLIYLLSSQRDSLDIESSYLFQYLEIEISSTEYYLKYFYPENFSSKPSSNASLELAEGQKIELYTEPKYIVESCSGDQVVNGLGEIIQCDVELGSGHVSVISSLDPFTNNNLRFLDNGSYLLWLVQDAQSITYIPYISYSSWFMNLWNWSWQLVILIFFLAIVYVWHSYIRIGLAYDPDKLAKTQFNEHIKALASFYIHNDHDHVLSDALKKDFFNKLVKRVPNIKYLNEEQQANVIAKLTHFEQQEIMQLLSGELPKNQQQRIDYIKRFKQLRNAL